VSVLSRQQADFVKERLSEAPRQLGRRKKRAIVQHSAKQERERRAAAHAKAFDAVVAGRPLKPAGGNRG
jgi:hypothetical protein